MKINILLKALISTCLGNEKFTCAKHKFTCEIYLWKICKAFYVVEKKNSFQFYKIPLRIFLFLTYFHAIVSLDTFFLPLTAQYISGAYIPIHLLRIR